jgi:hypothetical protein
MVIWTPKKTVIPGPDETVPIDHPGSSDAASYQLWSAHCNWKVGSQAVHEHPKVHKST